MKLCRDCKHFSFVQGMYMCDLKLNPIHGGPAVFADIEREYRSASDGAGCSRDGLKCEPRPAKKPFWMFWL